MISHTRINRDARVVRSARALLEAGYDLHLFCLRNKEEPELPAGLSTATLHEISQPRSAIIGFFNFAPIWFLAKAAWSCFRLKPAIVHCHDLNVLPVGVWVQLMRRTILIYDSHEIFTEKIGAGRLKWLWKFLERRMIRRCRLVITTTEARADFLERLYPGIRPPLVIHNYPDAQVGDPLDIRDAAGLPENSFVALYQGGIQSHRGLEQIIESAGHAEGTYFVIQGDGPDFEKIQRLAGSSPKREYIKVLPGMPYSELRRYTASADVGLQVLQPVSVNHTTTLSNKLFEYVQAGLPVIASNFQMISSFIAKYRFGFAVDPRNPLEIAKSLQSISRDPQLRATMSLNARNAALSLSWENEQILLLSEYDRIHREATGKDTTA